MTYRTKSGRVLTDADVEELADELANAEYDLDEVKARPGRPAMGSGPAVNVQVRLDPELRRALMEVAERDGMSVSEVIRRALRSHLAA